MSTKDSHQPVLDSQHTAAISEALKAAELPSALKASMKQRIFERIHSQAPEGAMTIRQNEGEWIDVAPKLKMKILRRDPNTNSQTALWKLEAGAVIPAHQHPVEEECLVIKGEINFGEHVLREGDFEVVPAGVDHIAMQSKTGATVMLRSDIPQDLSWID